MSNREVNCAKHLKLYIESFIGGSGIEIEGIKGLSRDDVYRLLNMCTLIASDIRINRAAYGVKINSAFDRYAVLV